MKESKIKKVLLKTALIFVSILLLTLAIFSDRTSEATGTSLDVPNLTVNKSTVNVNHIYETVNIDKKNYTVYCIQPYVDFHSKEFNTNSKYEITSENKNGIYIPSLKKYFKLEQAISLGYILAYEDNDVERLNDYYTWSGFNEYDEYIIKSRYVESFITKTNGFVGVNLW